MTCSKCGMPCSGEKCQACGRADHQEAYYGTVNEPEPDAEDDQDEGDDWAVVQQGLDGEAHTGQATIDGGVAKDGGDGA